MRRLLLLSVLILLAACSRQDQTAAPSRPSRPTPPTTRDFATPWQDETQYIVTTIATNLAEMVRLANAAQATETDGVTVKADEVPGAEVLTYRVSIGFPASEPLSCDITFNTPIWAPATYAPLVRALAARHALASSAGSAVAPAPPTIVAALLNPRVEIITDTDISLSKSLEARFTDPALHQEAAILLGAFALREFSGKFHQIRDELCAMTAHLAFADGLAPADASPRRRLADALLTLLYNNQSDALALIDSLPDADAYAHWKTALRLRATGDYRVETTLLAPTPLELRELFWAKTASIGAKRAWDDANLTEAQRAQADWYVIMAEESVPIRLGHAILRAGLAAQIQETAAAMARETGRAPTQQTLVAELNTPPARFAGPRDTPATPRRVIGWGRWAAASQRRICQLISVNFDFMQNRWGVPDDAADYRSQMDGIFQPLRLYPFVRRLNATRQDYYRAAQDDSRALMLSAPEIVPAEIWNYTCYTVKGCELYIPPPHGYVNEWHRYNPPPGTAYNPLPRMNQSTLVQQPDTIQRLEQLHRLAPYDTVITHNLLRIRDGDNQDPVKMAEAYRDVLDFHPMPNRRVARAYDARPAEYEKWMTRAAAIDPTDLHELARYFRKRGEERKAADTYIAWLKIETDEVSIANDAWFLVEYFDKNGRAAEATALAERAAEAYSFDGLLAKANLLERRGRLLESLGVHRQMVERYGTQDALIGFLWRAQRTQPSPRFAKELDQLVRERLPDGIAPFQSSAVPPARGVVVQTENDLIRGAGLRQGDIIVAVRGYQVTNWKCFKILRALDPRTPFEMTVWRDGALIELPPLDPALRFGVDLEDYAAR